MTTLIIAHQVENYAAWRTVYDNHQNVRDSHNIVSSHVYCDPIDGNQILVTMEGEANDLQGFINDPNLKAAMSEAGVLGRPTFKLLDALTATV